METTTTTTTTNQMIHFPRRKFVFHRTGTYQFPAMRRLAINSGDAFILVYSVDDPRSFQELQLLRQSILDEREQAFSETASGGSTSSVFTGSTSGLASGYSTHCSSTAGGLCGCTATSGNNLPATSNERQKPSLYSSTSSGIDPQGSFPVSPARHWSLASIFQHQHQHQNQAQQQQQQHQTSLHSSVGSITSSSGCFHHQHQCSSGSSSSIDHHSRRSSVSAAEAALKTRRTRRPPMVIVANKYDLPHDKHQVNSDEIEALVEIDWNNGFVRASALQNLNVADIFQQVLKQARQPPTLTAAIVSKRRKSLPPKLPQSATNLGNNNLAH